MSVKHLDSFSMRMIQLYSALEYSIPIRTSKADELLNQELFLVNEWLEINKSSLNIGKTKYMIFHPHQKDIIDLTTRLIMNGIEIERVETFDFLGVTLDENLAWKPHTDKVATKLSKYSGIMNKLKNYLPRYIMKTLYNSLVHSHLNYAILVWGFKCNRLVKLQKRLVRIITCSKYNAQTDPLFKSTEILKVANILDLNALKFYYKYLHGKLPSYFYSFNIVTQGSQHSYNTRQSEQIRTERTRAEYCDNRLKIFYHTLLTQSRSTCWKEFQLTVSKDSRPASNHIFSTCIQLSAPLPTAIFVTAINNNEMYISNVQWRWGHSRWPAQRRLGRLMLLSWLPGLHDSSRQWLGRTFDSPR